MNESVASISTLEKRSLLVLAFFPLLFFLTSFGEDAIRQYRLSTEPRPAITLAVDDPVPRTPVGLHLLTIPIFLSLIRPRRFFVAIVFAVVYAGLFLVSLYSRVDGESFLGGPIPGDPGFFHELYLKTWIWDYVAAAYLAVLLPWLSSIIYRGRLGSSRRVALS